MPDPAPLADLRRHLRSIKTLGSVNALLGWDQETYMPPRAVAARAEQSAALAALVHERATDPRLGEAIERAAAAVASEPASAEAALVREARRDYDKARKLPASLVAELAETGSRAQHVWKDARDRNDFPMFRPWLERMMELSRRKAECLREPAHAELYDALLNEYEPGATAADIQRVFAPLRQRLSALVAELLDRGHAPDASPAHAPVPAAQQHALGLRIVRAFGFDLDAGRLDTTAHPFCSGIAPGDTRLTTRYREQSWCDALFGTMHECGHGLYEQGLPKLRADGEIADDFGTPLADDISLGIHESQSRMWENFVGRGRAFWRWAKPEADACFAGALARYDSEALYRAVNRVQRSFIRVEADEATYNLHVMLRFGLERDLISGRLAVADLPNAWNDAFREALGVPVPDDRRGCLQDVHWSFGLVGYFPTYTLGNLYAAQFFEAIRERHADLDDRIARGDFAPILAWNREHIHRHGRRYSAAETCERATGKPLSPDPLLRHLEAKLRPIYGV